MILCARSAKTCHWCNSMPKKGRGRQIAKDKSSELRSSSILPEEATHFSDASDKIVWTKYGEKLKDKGGSFVPARVANENFVFAVLK